MEKGPGSPLELRSEPEDLCDQRQRKECSGERATGPRPSGAQWGLGRPEQLTHALYQPLPSCFISSRIPIVCLSVCSENPMAAWIIES